MTQQDYTAPEYAVRVSRKERYWDVFEVVGADGLTPDNSLSAVVFAADFFDSVGSKIGAAACSRPAANAVRVELSTAQMNALRPGRYRLEVYYLNAGEREDLVAVILTVE